ncbi:sugar kinase [Halomonas sp. McH1-25]|uniref:sugar kinase n=1 Tax=unclassified Halomonas TaxID=2609666 RepID=UPI001EF72FB7|nr:MULTISPECIES: sugar kinase [unclassified Halomonas]MCG7601560.1 sugar kinase [Halomonas sp. McH1-25]MCP1343358.1 sugar kinase [Halomonas sp. FL8]MCP1362611.1 sugar kinase [Halomonas sp. BBD45]MCP1364799.1 sugar kinase [Halomonas sp. BBD48]
MTRQTAPEILTFGEAMTLFAAEETGDLAEVERFRRGIAGADTNVAIGFARLGFHVGWLSRVGDDSFGRFIQHTLEAEGLDCRHLQHDPDHATGLVFKTRAERGEDPHVEYIRRGSAASFLSTADAAAVEFPAVRHLHATGIPPALSPSARELSNHMLERARDAGASISFDPNLRPSLWKSEREMCETINDLAAKADWVLPGLAEGRRLTGLESAHDIAGFYLDRGAKAVIIKLGPEGSFYRSHEDSFTVEGFKVVEVIDTVGAGDGFAVGAVSALLDGLSPRAAARRGNLIGSLAVQVPGDMEGLPHRDTLTALEAKLPALD